MRLKTLYRSTVPLLILLTHGAAHAQVVPIDAVARPDPIAIAIDKAEVTDPKLRTLYAKSKWRALWSKQSITAFQSALADRGRHGLDHLAFAAADEMDSSSAVADVARSRAALSYAEALAGGRIDPASLHEVYTLPRPKTDVTAGLGVALATGKLTEWLASLAPQDAEYRALSDAYLRFSQAAAAAGPTQLIAGGLIRVGDRDPRVAAIADQLMQSGYLAPSGLATEPWQLAPSPTSALYTQALADALKGLQTDYGISADGIVGPETLKVLNLGAGDRARALGVALERRRWLERTPPATRIDVNIAAARLTYWRDGKIADSRKVIVGEPDTETPQLGSPIFRLVANPTWTVPRSIQEKDIAKKGAGYLKANNMVWKNGWIVQQPGPKNSLGLVKFDMQNDHAIYLHDTPAKTLFAMVQRQRSHGCVRVDDALGFAELLAKDGGVLD